MEIILGTIVLITLFIALAMIIEPMIERRMAKKLGMTLEEYRKKDF